MKDARFHFVSLAFLLTTAQTNAQGFGSPLTFQGLNHATVQSAASRGMGGLTTGFRDDASLMFTNPASLTTISMMQVSVGGMQQNRLLKQTQEYGGLQYHSAFGLLMLGTTGDIRDPDTSLSYSGNKVTLRTQADSVQRPFDSIGPNWSRSTSKTLPIQVFVAAPFSVGETRFVGGVGIVEYANLNWSYQNNNALSPSILSVTDSTIATASLPLNDAAATPTKQPYPVQWYQYYQLRDGSIYGYGGSIATEVAEGLSAGLSYLFLSGRTDDGETRVGRGQMLFYSNSIRLTRQGMTSFTKTGTSDYSGQEFGLSAEYRGRYLDVGVNAQLPTTITRKFSAVIRMDSVAATTRLDGRIDSIHVATSSSTSGQDKIVLPLRGSIGVTLRIRENLTVGMGYEVRSFASAEYTSPTGLTSNPWLTASNLHLGLEYRAASWLSLRGGVTNYSEVFQPVTAAIRGEPVNYPVYSLGCGLAFENGVLNIAYEYSEMKYIDTWSNAASINQGFTNNLVAGFSYRLPW